MTAKTKKYIISTFVFSLIALSIQSQSDNIVGYWLTDEGESQIEIFKSSNGRYYGKIVWMKEKKDIRDTENPTASLRGRKVMGLQILNDFTWNPTDKEWNNGKIYDPKSGNTYSCYMKFEGSKNILKIKGYILGMRFLGKETLWIKEDKLRT